MAFALTKARAWGIETEEPINKRYKQFLVLNITGLNTDNALDLGNYVAGSLGTFWTAVTAASAQPGTAALAAIQDIASRAESFNSATGTGVRADWDVVTYLSAASVGGAASEALVVTGLAATDTILSVTPTVSPTNSVFLKGWSTVATNALTVTYSGDPGTAAKVTVTVRKANAITNLGPTINNLSGSAPTAYIVTLEWLLKDGHEPVSLYADATTQRGF